MTQLQDRDIFKALKAGRVIVIENHGKIDMLRRFDGILESEPLVLMPGEHSFKMAEVTIGASSPTNWLMLESPEVHISFEGASLGYFLSLHNNGKLIIHLQAPAEVESKATLEAS